jgi:lipid II:glycine glycyltransferase (peptidoglycan interpeptide bridge formation enzyme)
MDNKTPAENWNVGILKAKASFLQSAEWGRVQENLGREAFFLSGDDFSSLTLKYDLPLGRSYLYSPHGPVMESYSDNDFRSFVANVKKIAIGKKAIFLRIEPIDMMDLSAHNLRQAGFRETAAVQPKATRILDLAKSEKVLLAEMEHDTRYSIRSAEKRGVRVDISAEPAEKEKNFERFWSVFLETNKRHNLKMYPKKYYAEVMKMNGDARAELFIAEADGKDIGAAIIVFFGKTAFYLYAASLSGYGKFNAPTFILWQAILEAKKRGCEIFDFWGVSDENKAWRGVTAFKRSFGGAEMTYPGTWDYVFDRPWYALYKLAKKIL